MKTKIDQHVPTISERPNAVHVRIFRTITYRTYGRTVLVQNCRTPYIIFVHLFTNFAVLNFCHVRTRIEISL